MARKQLPQQISKVTLKSGEIRYQLSVAVTDTNGVRRWVKRRYVKEAEARAALAEIAGSAAAGAFVARSDRTVTDAVDDWLAGKRNIRATTKRGYEDSLGPVKEVLGSTPLRKLTKRNVDDLVAILIAGSLTRQNGRHRKSWSARSVNLMLGVLGQVLGSEVKQGHLVRNVAALVDRLPQQRHDMATYTGDEVRQLLAVADRDRNGHAWHLAMSGLRRGEVCGLRWTDIDLEHNRLTVGNNRVSAGGKVVENEPKTPRSRRTLPLTPALAASLKAARRQQAIERLALGEDYGPGTHVVCDEAGNAYHPETISSYWESITKTAKVRKIRLHDARHTCATLMHLQGVPIAVISAWLGHADASFTMRTYTHSQDDALTAAADVLSAVVSKRVNESS